MEFTDRVLKCIDCGAEFVFTAGEQVFFHDKQFKNDPKHCKQCKAKRARGGEGAPGDADHVLGVRGDDGSLQADPGQAGAVPVVLPKAAGEAGCFWPRRLPPRRQAKQQVPAGSEGNQGCAREGVKLLTTPPLCAS